MSLIRIRAPEHRLSRLYARLIRSYRACLAVQTGAVYVLTVGAFFAGSLVVDEALWLEQATRVLYWIFGVGVVTAAAVWFHRNMGKIGVERRVIHLVDRAHPELRGLFAAGLQFAQRDAADWSAYSPALLEASVAAAQERLGDLDLRPALRVDFGQERLGRLAACAGILIFILLELVTVSRPARIHALRILVPFLEWENYRMTVSPEDVELPAGSSCAIRVSMHIPVREDVLTQVRENQDLWTLHPMKKTPDGFEYVIPPIWKDCEYRVSHGMTTSRVFHIRIVSPPRIVAQRRHFRYPQYLGLPPDDESAWGPGVPLRVPRGTTVSIEARVSEAVTTATLEVLPLGTKHDGTAGPDLVRRRCQVENAGTRLRVSLYATQPCVYAFHVADALGHVDPDPQRFSLDVAADEVPKVQLTFSESPEDAARNATVPIPFTAEDDHSVTEAILACRIERGASWKGLPGYFGETSQEEIVARMPAHGAVVHGRFELRLWKLSIAPGDQVRLRVGALDNDDHFGPQLGWSRERTLAIVAPVMEATRSRQQRRDTQQEYNDLIRQTLAVRSSVQVAREDLERRRDLDVESRTSLKAAWSQQREIVQRMAEEATRMETSAGDLSIAGERRDAGDLRHVAAELRDVAQTPMTQARDAMQRALTAPHPGDHLALLTAQNLLDRALERLRARGRHLGEPEPATSAPQPAPTGIATAKSPPPQHLAIDPEYIRRQTNRKNVGERLATLQRKSAELGRRATALRAQTEEWRRTVRSAAPSAPDAGLDPADREDLQRLQTKQDAFRSALDHLRADRTKLAADVEALAHGRPPTDQERRSIEDREAALESDADRVREKWETARSECERQGLEEKKSENDQALALDDLDSDQHRAMQEWQKGDPQRTANAQKSALDDVHRLASEADAERSRTTRQFEQTHRRPNISAQQRAQAQRLAAKQSELAKEMEELAKEDDDLRTTEDADDVPLHSPTDLKDAAGKSRLAAQALKSQDAKEASAALDDVDKDMKDAQTDIPRDQHDVAHKSLAEELSMINNDTQAMKQREDRMEDEEQKIGTKEKKPQPESDQSGPSGGSSGRSGQSSSSSSSGGSGGQGGKPSSSGSTAKAGDGGQPGTSSSGARGQGQGQGQGGQPGESGSSSASNGGTPGGGGSPSDGSSPGGEGSPGQTPSSSSHRESPSDSGGSSGSGGSGGGGSGSGNPTGGGGSNAGGGSSSSNSAGNPQGPGSASGANDGNGANGANGASGPSGANSANGVSGGNSANGASAANGANGANQSGTPEGASPSSAASDPRPDAAAEAAQVKARAERVGAVAQAEPVRKAAEEVGDKAGAYGDAARNGADPEELARRRADLDRAVRRLDQVNENRSADSAGSADSADSSGNASGGGAAGGGTQSRTASAVAPTERLIGGRGQGGAAARGAGRIFTGEEAVEGAGNQLAADLSPEARAGLQEGRKVEPPAAFRRQTYAYFKALLEQRR